MKLLLENLRDKWMQLQLRERQLIILGSGLLIATSVYLSIVPQIQKYSELKLQIVTLNTDIQWLQQQRQVVERLVNGCASGDVREESSREQITRLIRRNQLTLDSMRDVNSNLKFSVTGIDANRVISLTHQIGCSGYDLMTLEIKRSEEGLMQASMEVTAIEN
jgi:type II secretory pathway component PulM|tara:strand:- start:1931 stop:2419 length:489 start_codon:yes stop_codon:yes gene_type:complete